MTDNNTINTTRNGTHFYNKITKELEILPICKHPEWAGMATKEDCFECPYYDAAYTASGCCFNDYI